MILAAFVGVVVLIALFLHRFSLEKRRRTRLPIWVNIRAIRKARSEGWSGINPELDLLLHDQFVERMQKKEHFWRMVTETERKSRSGE